MRVSVRHTEESPTRQMAHSAFSSSRPRRISRCACRSSSLRRAWLELGLGLGLGIGIGSGMGLGLGLGLGSGSGSRLGLGSSLRRACAANRAGPVSALRLGPAPSFPTLVMPLVLASPFAFGAWAAASAAFFCACFCCCCCFCFRCCTSASWRGSPSKGFRCSAASTAGAAPPPLPEVARARGVRPSSLVKCSSAPAWLGRG